MTQEKVEKSLAGILRYWESCIAAVAEANARRIKIEGIRHSCAAAIPCRWNRRPAAHRDLPDRGPGIVAGGMAAFDPPLFVPFYLAISMIIFIAAVYLPGTGIGSASDFLLQFFVSAQAILRTSEVQTSRSDANCLPCSKKKVRSFCSVPV